MYNVTTAAAMIAVAQQAIKKAPVTSSFAEEKSQAGLTVWINYDRFSTIGQVFLIIPSSAYVVKEKDDGFLPGPLSYNSSVCIPHCHSDRWVNAASLFSCVFLFQAKKEYSQAKLPVVKTRRKPGTTNTWLSIVSDLNCISRCD
jgi:hypothetical protein